MKRFIEINDQNTFQRIQSFLEEKFKILENIEKINLLSRENDEKSNRILKSEEKIQTLERKLFSLGKYTNI
jgi:hypothetical protein